MIYQVITNLHKFQLAFDIESTTVIIIDPVTLLLSSYLIWSHFSALMAKTPKPMPGSEEADLCCSRPAQNLPFSGLLQGDIRFIQGLVRRKDIHLDSTESYAVLCFADAVGAVPLGEGLKYPLLAVGRVNASGMQRCA